MLAALLTFQDQSEEIHNGNNNNSGVLSPNVRTPAGDTMPGKSGAEIVEQIQVKAGVCDTLRFSSFITLNSNSRRSRTKLWSQRQERLKTMRYTL